MRLENLHGRSQYCRASTQAFELQQDNKQHIGKRRKTAVTCNACLGRFNKHENLVILMRHHRQTIPNANHIPKQIQHSVAGSQIPQLTPKLNQYTTSTSPTPALQPHTSFSLHPRIPTPVHRTVSFCRVAVIPQRTAAQHIALTPCSSPTAYRDPDWGPSTRDYRCTRHARSPRQTGHGSWLRVQSHEA